MSTESTTGQRSYWCFISYRHADNKEPGRQWATWLHQAIETYVVPSDLVGTVNERGDVIPEHIFPVFRDEDELPADADLASPIYRALAASKFLVVICSPRAVDSLYVGNEIRYFKRLGRGDHVLAAMIEGEPNASWDAGKQAMGFKVGDECFPEAIRHQVAPDGALLDERTEPIAADFRLGTAQGWASPEAYRLALHREGRNPRAIDAEVEDYRKKCELMKLKIIAGILGVPLGTLTQRDRAYQLTLAHKRAKILRRWLAAVGVLAVLAIAGGCYGWWNERIAVIQRNETEIHLKAAVAINLLDSSPEQGLRLALCAADDSIREFGAPFSDVQESLTDALSRASELNSLDPGYANLDRSAISGDGKHVLMAGDGQLTLFDLGTGKKLCAFSANPGVQSSAVALTPTGDVIASAARDGSVRWWSSTGVLLGQIPGSGHGWVTALAFSPDGQKIATGGSDRRPHLWDLHGNALPGPFVEQHTNPISTVLFSPDGKMIASADNDMADSTIELWHLDGTLACPPIASESGGVTCAAFSPDGNTLATGGLDSIVRFWNMRGESSFQSLTAPDGVQSLCFKPDGSGLAIAASRLTANADSEGTGVVSLWNLHGKPWHEPIPTERIRTLAFGPGETLAMVGNNRKCRVYGLNLLQAQSGIELGHASNDIAILPDGRTMITGDANGNVNFSDFSGRQVSPSLTVEASLMATPRIKLSPTSDWMGVVARGFPVLRLWNYQNGWKELKSIDNHAPIDSFAFSAASGRVVMAMMDKIWLRDLAGKVIAEPRVDSRSIVNQLAFSPDGKLFVASTVPDIIPIWNSDGQLMARIGTERLGGISVLKFSPDGKLLVVAYLNGYVALYEMKNFTRAAPLMHLGKSATVPLALAFSPDSQRFASGGANLDGTLFQIWDTKGDPLTPPIPCWPIHSSMLDLTFTPDGKTLLTEDKFGHITFWIANWQGWIDLACRRLQHHPILQTGDAEANKAKEIVARRLADAEK
jgi:WD40 repeat protein